MNDRPLPAAHPGQPRRPEPKPLSHDLPSIQPSPGALDLSGPGSEHHPYNHPSSEAAPSNRRLIVTLLVSLGLHAAAVIAVLLLLHAAQPVEATVDKPTEVELVMEEHKGDPHPTTAPSSPSPPAPKPPQHKADPSEAKAAKPPVAMPDTPQSPAEATPVPSAAEQPSQETTPEPPAQAPVQEATRAPDPAPPATERAPVISLQGTDSPSNARAFGDRVIPARPDAVFHNRPPIYPDEAAQNGQQGTVVVLIHVSPAGTTASVDLVRSSGYVLLDRAAQEAVLRWRFLPAVKDGQPVASDMTMGFIFDNLR
jgi:periplasmic protein TonB